MPTQEGGEKSVKARFYLLSDKCKVTDVGCRVKILRLLLESTLEKGLVRNVPKENKVEVIVEGRREDVINFRKTVEQTELPDVALNPGFAVTDLELAGDFKSMNLPEINRVANSLMLEQLDKGVGAFVGVADGFKAFEKGFGAFEKRFESFEKTFEKRFEAFGKALEGLPRNMAEELKKVINK